MSLPCQNVHILIDGEPTIARVLADQPLTGRAAEIVEDLARAAYRYVSQQPQPPGWAMGLPEVQPPVVRHAAIGGNHSRKQQATRVR